MSYYVDVSIDSAPPIVHQRLMNDRGELSAEDEVRLYLFISDLFKTFPKESDSNESPWGNDISFNDGKVSLIFTYSGARIALPVVRTAARRYGLSVFDYQTDERIQGKLIPLNLEDKTVSRQAHKFINELKEWSSFCKELDKYPSNSDGLKQLEELVIIGSGPAKRVLSFRYFLLGTKSETRQKKEHYFRLAYKLATELHGFAYEPQNFIPLYLEEAKHEGITIKELDVKD
jgi:hypothetical protein